MEQSAPDQKSQASFTKLVAIWMSNKAGKAGSTSDQATRPRRCAIAEPTRKGTTAAPSVLGRDASSHARSCAIRVDAREEMAGRQTAGEGGAAGSENTVGAMALQERREGLTGLSSV